MPGDQSCTVAALAKDPLADLVAAICMRKLFACRNRQSKSAPQSCRESLRGLRRGAMFSPRVNPALKNLNERHRLTCKNQCALNNV
jgi:hypothetical protein